MTSRATLLAQRVRDALFADLGLKALSLAFALGLYAFSHGSQDAQRTFEVAVVEKPPPEAAHRVLVSPLPPAVRVTVRGSRTLLDELRADDLGTLTLDLSNGRAGRIDLYPSAIHVPAGLRAEAVDPTSIELRWDDEVVREVPIQASITGQPAPGFVVKGAPRVEPASVRARGPREALEVLQYARAAALDVTGLGREGTVQRSVAIDRPPQHVTYDVSAATVKVEVTRELLERLFVKLPVLVLGVARATTFPSDVDVRVVGPPEVVQALRAEQIVPRIDVRGAGSVLGIPTSTELPVKVNLDHIEAHVTPQTVVVHF